MTAKVAKAPNYTEEMTAKVIADYNAGVDVAEIAAALGKTKRSVISKLVREGVYVAVEKPVAAKKNDGPSKKDIIDFILTADGNAPVDGLMPASKAALSYVLGLLTTTDKS